MTSFVTSPLYGPVDLLIRKLPFARVVREVAQDFYVGSEPLRWQALAVMALQEVGWRLRCRPWLHLPQRFGCFLHSQIAFPSPSCLLSSPPFFVLQMLPPVSSSLSLSFPLPFPLYHLASSPPPSPPRALRAFFLPLPALTLPFAGRRGLPGSPLRGRQLVRNPRQARDHHDPRHPGTCCRVAGVGLGMPIVASRVRSGSRCFVGLVEPIGCACTGVHADKQYLAKA